MEKWNDENKTTIDEKSAKMETKQAKRKKGRIYSAI